MHCTHWVVAWQHISGCWAGFSVLSDCTSVCTPPPFVFAFGNALGNSIANNMNGASQGECGAEGLY